VDRLPKLEHIIVHRDAPSETSALPSHLKIHDLADLYLEGNVPQPKLDRRSTAVILHTSGTTGPPKGVVISHEAVLHLVRRTVWLMDYTRDDRLFTAFPLFHQNAKYTSVCAAMECGGSLIMERRFSASRFWDLCREKNITAFNYMGALLMMLYKQPVMPNDADNPVRIAFGAPCPAAIWEDFERRFGIQLVEIYGMTESPLACENRLEYRRIGSAGKESDTYQVQIVDERDNPLPPDTPGEIVVRPKLPGVLFTEYYKRPRDTVEAWRNLWFHTGDRGRMDADGYLYFIDRMKDCIRRRGENISSWEIENTVNTHPSILESAAYGVASELTEYEVIIAIVLRPGAELLPAELISFCKNNMTRFAVPRYVRVCNELPKNASGRIQKFKLREDGITKDTWDYEAQNKV
jgi:crotonobetaine/carnitine-CoA ligase